MIKRKGQAGVSLVELLLVVAAVGFLVMLIANLPSSVSSINKSRHLSIAKDISNRKMESLRKEGFSALSNQAKGESSFTDPDLNSLPAGAAVYDLESCPPLICGANEQALQVKVRVNWNELGDNKFVELLTLVGEGGVGQ